jgi:hypothetical protein
LPVTTLKKVNFIKLFVILTAVLSPQTQVYSQTTTPVSATTAPAAESAPTSTWVNPAHTSEDYMPIKEGWFIGADIGKTVFYGDVTLYNIFPAFKDFKVSLGNGGSFYFGKKFKFGLSAEIQGFMGSLRGEKRSAPLYPRYFVGDYYQYAVNAKYNLSQLIFRDSPGRKFFNRFTVYLTVGGGQMFFRSRLYKYANNNQWYLENATGYTTAHIDSAGPNSGGGIVVNKTKMAVAIAIPVGLKINFKLNAQTDMVLDFTYTTIFSDKVDSWERTWSHKDRYLYIGFGLCHNLARNNSGDVPDDQRLLRPKNKSKSKTNDAYDKDDQSSKPERKRLFGGGKSSRPDKKGDKDLEVRMKMYELQLKLFEMQYLMGGG